MSGDYWCATFCPQKRASIYRLLIKKYKYNKEGVILKIHTNDTYSISHSNSKRMAIKHCEHDMLCVCYMHVSTQYHRSFVTIGSIMYLIVGLPLQHDQMRVL